MALSNPTTQVPVERRIGVGKITKWSIFNWLPFDITPEWVENIITFIRSHLYIYSNDLRELFENIFQ